MRRALTAALAVLGLLAASPAPAQGTLSIGDPAPPLSVKAFVKGQPVKALSRGKTYVVEFWATWCGPCRTTMPHLSALQKKYPAVTFIGVSVWENDQKAVKPFVNQMGSKIAYRVALDSVPAGAGGNQGKMARSWMTAAGEGGIPTAFIVNAQGKIAWIGHPMQMDGPLAQVVKGTWNIGAAGAARKRARAQQEKLARLAARLQQAKTPAQRLKVVDEILAAEPGLASRLGFLKLGLMHQTGARGVAAYAGKLSAQFKSDPMALNQVAWTLVDPAQPKPAPDVAKVALAAAQRADQLRQGKDPAIADTLGRAYFVAGDPTRALAAQQRAVKLAAGTPAAADPGLKQRLEQYRKAAKR